MRVRQGSRGVHDKALGGIQALCEGLAVRLLIVLRGVGSCQLPEGTLKLRIVILPAIRAHLQPQAKLFLATDSRLAWSTSAAMPSHTWRVDCTDLVPGESGHAGDMCKPVPHYTVTIETQAIGSQLLHDWAGAKGYCCDL